MTKITHYKKIVESVFSVIIGLTFIGIYFFRDRVESKSDLTEINAPVKHYSFQEHRGVRTHTFYYYLYLHGYNCRFQIGADFVGYFNKGYFEKNVKHGDNITIKILMDDFKEISTKENVLVYGISDSTMTYLDYDNTIREHNDNGIVYAGLLFIIVGLVLFFWNNVGIKKE